MKTASILVFRITTPCSLVYYYEYKSFEGTHYVQSSTMKMKAVSSTERLVTTYSTTWCHTRRQYDLSRPRKSQTLPRCLWRSKHLFPFTDLPLILGIKLQAYYNRYKWTGTVLLQALRMHWHSITTDTANALAQEYDRHCVCTGTVLLQALRMHWHRIITGTAYALAQDYYRHCLCTGTGLLQALRMHCRGLLQAQGMEHVVSIPDSISSQNTSCYQDVIEGL